MVRILWWLRLWPFAGLRLGGKWWESVHNAYLFSDGTLYHWHGDPRKWPILSLVSDDIGTFVEGTWR